MLAPGLIRFRFLKLGDQGELLGPLGGGIIVCLDSASRRACQNLGIPPLLAVSEIQAFVTVEGFWAGEGDAEQEAGDFTDRAGGSVGR